MSPREPEECADFERVALAESRLGFTFDDRELLRAALTHPSHMSSAHVHEHEHYERLEFLGDAVLGLLMSDHLYRAYPDMPEGRMTKIRSAFVSSRALASHAEAIGLQDAVILGRGAESMRAEHTRSLLADAFEAVLAAIYLDKGLDKVREFLFGIVTPESILAVVEEAAEDDPKNILQEYTQAEDGTLPEYRISDIAGPPHARSFTAEVSIGNRVLGTGTGASKKDAQRRAAQAALDTLEASGAIG